MVAEEGIRLAEALEDGQSLEEVHHSLMHVYQMRGEPERVKARAKLTVALAEREGFAMRVAMCHIVNGWAQVAGDRSEAGLADYQSTGAGGVLANYFALLGEARMFLGQPEAA